jgi:hypothetical protein
MDRSRCQRSSCRMTKMLRQRETMPMISGLHKTSKYLVSEILGQVASAAHATDLWREIQATFFTRSRARVINTRMVLASTVKGTLSVSEYYGTMKKLANEMEYAGKKLDPEEFTSYVLARLDMDYNSVVSTIAARVESILSSELLSQMLAMNCALRSFKGKEAMGISRMQMLPCIVVVHMVVAVDVVVVISPVDVVAVTTLVDVAMAPATIDHNVNSVAR